jgi:hypothetical protein
VVFVLNIVDIMKKKSGNDEHVIGFDNSRVSVH